jgi:hypothetical protein
MKNSIIWVVLLAGVVTTFNSCKETPDPIPAIVGTWTRQDYTLTEFPATFSGYEDITISSFGETGYVFVFKADGTYTRTVTFNPGLNDDGTWTLEGNELKVNPSEASDLTIIETYDFLGTEFDVEGEISNIRLTLSQTLNLCCFASDAAWDAAGGIEGYLQIQ